MLVLILIVVDNGLVLTIEAWMQGIAKVLILIVVDNGLVQLWHFAKYQWELQVLILIVVDNGLVLSKDQFDKMATRQS